jgi:hypothetical protein
MGLRRMARRAAPVHRPHRHSRVRVHADREACRDVDGDLLLERSGSGFVVRPANPSSGSDRPQTATDPGEKLRSLRRLLDDGLITQAEYDTKKADLLARM